MLQTPQTILFDRLDEALLRFDQTQPHQLSQNIYDLFITDIERQSLNGLEQALNGYQKFLTAQALYKKIVHANPPPANVIFYRLEDKCVLGISRAVCGVHAAQARLKCWTTLILCAGRPRHSFPLTAVREKEFLR